MASKSESSDIEIRLEDFYPPESVPQREIDWHRLVHILKEGGVVILPTDTVYGLHSRWDNPEGRHRIMKLKGRPPSSALLCLINSEKMLERVAVSPQTSSFRKLKEHWPGPLTMILPAGPLTPPAVQVNGTVAIRWPDDPFLIRLIEDVGFPLLSTSANPSGRAPAKSTSEIPGEWKRQVDAIVDGGSRTRPPSTLIRVSSEGGMEILRQGHLKIDLESTSRS